MWHWGGGAIRFLRKQTRPEKNKEHNMYLSYRIQERHRCVKPKIPKSCNFWRLDPSDVKMVLCNNLSASLVHFQQVLTRKKRKKNMLYKIYKSISSHLTWALFSPCCAKREVASQLEAWDASWTTKGVEVSTMLPSSCHLFTSDLVGETIASFNDVSDQFQL